MKKIYTGLIAMMLAGCNQLIEDKWVTLIKKTPGNQKIDKDLIGSKIIAECKTNTDAKAYFGWIELKPVQITLDKTDNFVGKPMASYKLYFIVLDKQYAPEEIHRGEEYMSALDAYWRKIGCGDLPTISDAG